MSDELIREVQEDLQRERMMALFQRYGIVVAGLVLLLILGTAGYVGWQHWRASVRAEESARLFTALTPLEQGRFAEAAGALDAVAKDASAGVATVARLQQGEALAQDHKVNDAAGVFDQVADAQGVDPLLRDVATLASVTRVMDTEDPARIVEQLLPLTSGDRPLRHQARELMAVAQIQQGKPDSAKRTLDDALQDGALPPGARERMVELRATLESAS